MESGDNVYQVDAVPLQAVVIHKRLTLHLKGKFFQAAGNKVGRLAMGFRPGHARPERAKIKKNLIRFWAGKPGGLIRAAAGGKKTEKKKDGFLPHRAKMAN